MLTIDGSMGEGGGQILRTSLTLSMCLDKPFRIINIRRARRRPGLRRQHLVAVNAAARISSAEVQGATLGSQHLTFVPQHVAVGNYHFDIGSAGSTSLVFQTLMPVFLTASGHTHLVLQGGTHNPLAPTFDFLKQVYLPLINRMGPRVSMKLEKPGFYPAGGGVMHADIDPVRQLLSFQLIERGEILDIEAVAMISNLPLHIAQRELKVLERRLGIPKNKLLIDDIQTAAGPGNVIYVTLHFQHHTEMFTGFGMRGVRAETVASRVVEYVQRYLKVATPVSEHLADQLLLPLALAGGGAYQTMQPSLHATTNMEVIQKFMDIEIRCDETETGVWRISLSK